LKKNGWLRSIITSQTRTIVVGYYKFERRTRTDRYDHNLTLLHGWGMRFQSLKLIARRSLARFLCAWEVGYVHTWSSLPRTTISAGILLDSQSPADESDRRMPPREGGARNPDAMQCNAGDRRNRTILLMRVRARTDGKEESQALYS
jgi:hypothetical protein